MAKITADDIIDFIDEWCEIHGYAVSQVLTNEQITMFVKELQEQIAMMDFVLPKGTTIIGYSGDSNHVGAWQIVEMTSALSGESATYISDTDAGALLNDERLINMLKNLIVDDNAVNMILSGCDSAGNRIGPNCGFGDYFSLDDFVSAKLMEESVGVSDNIIVFAPEELNANKVFCTTEIERIFANDTFKFINGIPKGELSALYFSGEEGRNAVFQIISRTSREVVGSTSMNCNISAYITKTIAA